MASGSFRLAQRRAGARGNQARRRGGRGHGWASVLIAGRVFVSSLRSAVGRRGAPVRVVSEVRGAAGCGGFRAVGVQAMHAVLVDGLPEPAERNVVGDESRHLLVPLAGGLIRLRLAGATERPGAEGPRGFACYAAAAIACQSVGASSMTR